MRAARRRLRLRSDSLSVPPGTLRQRPEAGLKARGETMAARVLRVPVAGPRGILAAEQVVRADDPERKRSGFREPRREMCPSGRTASQVGSPFIGGIAPFYDAQKIRVGCPCRLTRPGQQRLCSSASVASRRLAPGLRPPPLAHRNWRRRHERIQVFESRHGSRAHHRG
jgi:hypothetical protein